MENWAATISDAARIVRASIPRHVMDLDELVQIGWEKIARYLSDATSADRTLVFITARNAMWEAVNRWRQRGYTKNASGNRVRRGPVPELTGWHDWMTHQPTPPIEMMIDVKRALERCAPEESSAWTLTRWQERSVDDAAAELQCRPATVIARARRADARVTMLAGGERTARHGRTPVRSRKRDEWRRRYRELRSLGVAPAHANRAANSVHGYATALRKATACAT